MKRILKALGKTLSLLGIGLLIGSTPVILTNLLGSIPALIVVIGLLISILFYVIYINEKH